MNRSWRTERSTADRRSCLRHLSARTSPGHGGILIFSVLLLLGAVSASQSKINGALAIDVGDAVIAAMISNFTAMVLLGAILCLYQPSRRGLYKFYRVLRNGGLRGWEVLGGIAGGFYALTQTSSAAPLGLALFTLSLVCGQAIGGVIFDHLGVGPGAARVASPRRLSATAIVTIGVSIAAGGQFSSGISLSLLWMPLVAGVGQAWQSAMNGRVRAATRSAMATTVVNYAVGTLALFVLLALRVAVGWGDAPSFPTEPMMYLGGFLGCAFIAGSALVVARTGVLVLGLGVVAGQLCFSLLLDLAMPTSATVSLPMIIGAFLAFVAIFLASSDPLKSRLSGPKRLLTQVRKSNR